MITNVEIDTTSVKTTRSSVNFTVMWSKPFANFDPIVNYTVTINCTNATLCPAVFSTDNVTTRLNVSIITDLSVRNHISVTASNSIGTSVPATKIIVGKQ